MTIGEKLRACRKWANLTQKELGEKVGIDGATVGKYERGVLKPKRETLIKFEDALNYCHGTFYRDTDEAFQTVQDAKQELYGVDGWIVVYPDMETGELTRETMQNPLNTRLEAAFSKLNAEGKEVAIERVEELAQIPKYQRTDAPAGDDLTPDDVSEADPAEKA